MKKVSKLLAVVMAFSIMVALNVAVFATTTKTDGTKANVVNGGETAKINVLTGNENDVLNAYKVVETIYDKDTNTINRNFTATFEQFTAANTEYKTMTVDDYVKLNETKLKEVLGKFAFYVRTNNVNPEYVSTNISNEEKAEFETVAMGQYIIVGSGNTNGAYIYQTVTAEVEPFVENDEYKIYEQYSVKMKVSKPTVEKNIINGTATDGNRQTASVGDVITYKLSAAVPIYPEGATDTTLYLGDELSEGLTLDLNSIVVKGESGENAKGLINGNEYTVKHEGQKFYVDLNYGKIKTYTTVTVEYKATLNEKAKVGTAVGNENIVNYVYKNSPFDGTTYNSEDSDRPTPDTPGFGDDDDKEIVYTFGVAIEKIDKDNNAVKLKNAKFKLYDNKECKGDAIKEIVTNENGIASFEGLKAGKYYLVETMAPSGYKKLLEPIEIVVNAASGIYTITADKTEITTDIEKENGYKKVTVENKKGATLPTAGGMGTALFVAGGLIIMLGAATGVYVIRRKTVKER